MACKLIFTPAIRAPFLKPTSFQQSCWLAVPLVGPNQFKSSQILHSRPYSLESRITNIVPLIPRRVFSSKLTDNSKLIKVNSDPELTIDSKPTNEPAPKPFFTPEQEKFIESSGLGDVAKHLRTVLLESSDGYMSSGELNKGTQLRLVLVASNKNRLY